MCPSNFHIVEIDLDHLDRFYAYLSDQLSDNGMQGQPLFQPQSRLVKGMPEEKRRQFEAGLSTPVHKLGWRRLWVALTRDDNIVGHMDLRSHPHSYTEHRALLGMGVHRDFRKRGLGKNLLDFAEHWSRDTDVIQWIDLQVLGNNEPAKRLYEHAGYTVIGRYDDLFRIDGHSESSIHMAKRISNGNT